MVPLLGMLREKVYYLESPFSAILLVWATSQTVIEVLCKC